MAVFLDEADWLARADTRFDDRFLGAIRSRGQAKQLLWVSASKQNLRELLPGVDLGSPFLNDSEELVVGELSEDAARELLGAGLETDIETALFAAGRVPIALQAAGRLLQAGTEASALVDALGYRLRHTFRGWWQAKSKPEQNLLRAANGTRTVRGPVAAGLAARGLLRRTEGGYAIPGAPVTSTSCSRLTRSSASSWASKRGGGTPPSSTSHAPLATTCTVSGSCWSVRGR